MIKTIVCTGDSHTWGQGATGIIEYFTPEVVAGDLRLTPFRFNSYVNILRQMINRDTKSFATEFSAEQICTQQGAEFRNGCAIVKEKPFVMNLKADLIRIEFLAQSDPSNAEIWIDGKCVKDVDLLVQNSFNAYKICPVFCESQNEHALEIKSSNGEVLVYRIEAYSGEYAVINSGIGSCTTSRFLNEYWDDYVKLYQPHIVIMEAHTINDWLEGSLPEVYIQRLIKMIEKFKALGATPVLMTVSPIMGAQSKPYNNIDYSKYITASISAATQCGTSIADANKIMYQNMNGYTQEQKRAFLFNDDWHVNDAGHQIYAEAAFEKIIL